MIYALWHGGANYGFGTMQEDLEVFPSIAAAREELIRRDVFGAYYKQTFHYADGREEHVFTPNAGADEGARMSVYLADPREKDFPYPDRMIEFGPRGGVKVTRV